MKQKIFKPKFVIEDLIPNVETNLPKYRNLDYDWEQEALEKDAIVELDFEQPDLSGMFNYADNSLAVNDFYAGKILFEAYQNLTELQAAQSHFWAYLSHVVLYKYLCVRWAHDDGSPLTENNVKEHWFYKNGKIRNCLEGMFWMFKKTAIPLGDGQYDYKYTKMMFSIQKLGNRGIAAATFVFGNTAVVQGMLDFYIEELQKKESDPEHCAFDKHFEYRTDKCIQLVNELGGVIDLSEYSKEDITNFLRKNWDYIKSVGDRKKEKKAREETLEAEGQTTNSRFRSQKKGKKRKIRRR